MFLETEWLFCRPSKLPYVILSQISSSSIINNYHPLHLDCLSWAQTDTIDDSAGHELKTIMVGALTGGLKIQYPS